MTCENNKQGCNNKILIRTWMLASMVCMLSVSDMLGGCHPPQLIDPDEAMEKIKENSETWKEFMEIFKDHEDLIKRNGCCCRGIDIKNTMLPKNSEEGESAIQLTVYKYISDRFVIKDNKADIAGNWDMGNATCGALDTIIQKIYGASSP
jgi:hypothetical protein